MINTGTSDNLDVSADSFLDQFPAGLEEEETSNATNKDNTLSEELLQDEFHEGLGADLTESQLQKQEEYEHQDQQDEQDHQDQQQHQQHQQQQEQEDDQLVNIYLE